MSRQTNSIAARAFDIYLGKTLIDTVYYGRSVNVDVEEMKKSLINHDGYDSRITVREVR